MEYRPTPCRRTRSNKDHLYSRTAEGQDITTIRVERWLRTLAERDPVGDPVAATDTDAGGNPRIDLHVGRHDDASSFTIDSGTGQI